MAKHRYTYHGKTTVQLPEFGILAEGGDTKTVYETDKAIHNSDFEAVKEDERKERKDSDN